jgi:hypothetical protein
MSDTSLSFTITVKGDEPTVRNLFGKLKQVGADCSELADLLSARVQQTLEESGATGDIEVNFHCGQIRTSFGQGGGLSATEWLESDQGRGS